MRTIRRNAISRARRLALSAAAAIFAAAPPAHAADKTWTGAANDGGNWNGSGNWNPTGIPDTGSDLIFDGAGAGFPTVTILGTNASAHTLTFNSAATAYTITSSAPILSGLTTITRSSGGTIADTISLSNITTGSLLSASGNSLTINNNTGLTSPTSPTLIIGPSTVIGAQGGGGGLFVGGSGTTTISGSFSTTGNLVTGGLTKTGSGILTLSGNNSGLAGTVNLAGGNLRLDYTSSTANKLGSGNSAPAGSLLLSGALTLIANPSTAVTQSVSGSGGTVLNTGHSSILPFTNGGALAALTLNLNSISRPSIGGTLDVDISQTGATVATSNGVINGLLGGWFTVNNGASWAAKSGTNLAPLAGLPADSYLAGTNTDVTTSASIPTGTFANSLRFNTAGSPTLTLAGSMVIQSGGILATTAGSGATFNGGTISTGSPSELIVHAYKNVTINSALQLTGGLTKTGPNLLTLGGSLASMTGPLNINQGSILFTDPIALPSASSPINLNDRTATLQSIIFDFADGTNITSSTPIRLGSSSQLSNQTTNSRITLAGQLTSPGGVITPLTFIAGGSGGAFSLTNPLNSITGDISVGGNTTLSITDNAVLGDPANRLLLSTGPTAGGLEFLSNGTDLTHSITLNGASRIIVNPGNTNTISGLITGGTGLVKDGAGTLILTAANTLTGGVQVNAGTLSVSATNNLGPSGGLTIKSAGALAATGTVTLSSGRTVTLGPADATGTPTIDVAAGQTVTFAGALTNSGGDGALLKTGPGTLALTNTSSASTYSGGTTVEEGTLLASLDTSLGASTSPITIQPFGTLTFTNSTASVRAFTLNGGTLSVAAGRTLALNGAATVAGGFMSGPGTFGLSAGASLAGVTATSSSIFSQTGPATVRNFTNNGQFTVNSGQTLNWINGTNTSAGRLTILGTANVNDFVSDGQITIPAGGTLSNTLTPLVLGGGSTTFIGLAGVPGGSINLGGQTLELRGGLLSNNGTITGTTNINFGGLAKGAGTYGPVNVLDGGKFSPGNSPGVANSGAVTWGQNGGYLFEINDAAGTQGVNWDLWNINGSLDITAGTTNNSRFTLSIASLTAANASGNAANFNNAQNYSWLIASANSGITGFAANKFTLDQSQFTNSIGSGSFSLSQTGNNLFLNFNSGGAPVPQWNVDANGSWSTAANWDPPAVPSGSTAIANFLGKITAAHTVTLDGPKTVSAINFDNSNSYTIAPGSGGSLTIGDGTTGSINVANGSHEISASVTFSGAVTKTGGGTLTLSGPQNPAIASALTVTNGQINLNSNVGAPASAASAAVATLSLAVNNSGRIALGSDQDVRSLNLTTSDPGPQQFNLNSPASAGSFRSLRIYAPDLAAAKTSLYAALKNANAAGAPDPTDGIFDSGRGLHANSAIGLALLTDSHGDPTLLMRLTRIGDLNLDGIVTIADFINLASHFNQSGTWQEGDLNYDGQVTIADFITLASNFNQSFSGQVLPISPQDQLLLDNFAAAHAVPEPASLTFFAAALASHSLPRRRRPAK